MQKLIWPQKEFSFPGPMLKATVLPGAEVLATITLPFAPPAQGRPIGSRFGAIHSNPPALTPGTDPGIVWNTFGKGKSVWVAAPIESSSEAVNARLVAALLKRVLPGPYRFEVETHPSVEMTLFHQEEKKRMLAGLLTMQEQLPPIPGHRHGAGTGARGQEGHRRAAPAGAQAAEVQDGRRLRPVRSGAF